MENGGVEGDKSGGSGEICGSRRVVHEEGYFSLFPLCIGV